MILSRSQILAAVKSGDILIDPFDENELGTNSYDVHLGDTLLTYKTDHPDGFDTIIDDKGMIRHYDIALDAKREQPTREHKIGPNGFWLLPEQFYLGVTQEYTETHKHVPFLDGKSSTGRLSAFIHCTAGRGDVGFCNHWTMELVVTKPVKVYVGMPIGQLIYFETGPVDLPYNKKPNAKYTERCARPQPSQMFRNFK